MSISGDDARTSQHLRPGVSVVLPFAGSREEFERAREAILALRRIPDDEVIVVDNTGVDTVSVTPGIRVVRASREPSAYYARNEGTAAARNQWLLFIDADCRPRPDLLERYFAEPIPEALGAL